jgi:deoxyribonuclease-4
VNSELPGRRRNPVGSHVPVAGGLSSVGLSYAREIGAETVQVFVANPRGWATPAGNARQDEEFRAACAAESIPAYVHAPYLINFGSHTEATVEKSVESLREHMLPLLDELTHDDDPFLLLESTAGQGSSLCSRTWDFEPYFEALDAHPKLGVCLDTCHIFAAGHDLTGPSGMHQTLDLLVETVGEGRLKLIHANDSKDVVGAHKDRHANIGAGHIGEDPFRALMTHPATEGVPLIIETPGGTEGHAADVERLKKLRDG